MSLKDWLIAQVEPVCDAEPSVLADYILALLKHDLPPAELRQLFISQLEDFLKDETSPFVDRLFEHLASSSALSRGPARGTKRVFDDGGIAAPPGKAARVDLNAYRSGANGPIVKKEELCRDYHRALETYPCSSCPVQFQETVRGYCARGEHCTFLHDERPDISAQFYVSRMPSQAVDVSPGSFQQSQRNGPAPPPPVTAGSRGSAASAAIGGQPKDRRGQFDNRLRLRSRDTLVVEHIPSEHLSFDSINSFFRKFGSITNLSLDYANTKALIAFSTPKEAKAAHSSPEPVFGNRFVRIYFHRFEEPGSSGPHGQRQCPVPTQVRQRSPAPGLVSANGGNPVAARRNALAARMKERQSLQATLDDSIDRQKSLMAQLESATLADRAVLMNSLRATMSTINDARKALIAATPEQKITVSQSTSPLMDEQRAKLQALREEAASLGIDPSAPDAPANPTLRFSGGGARAEGRARGRGLGPSRRGFGARGGSAFAGRSLDNRSKKLIVTGLISQADVDSLRSHMLFLEADMEALDAASYVLSFTSRSAAEKFLADGSAALPITRTDSVRIRWMNTQSNLASLESPSDNNATVRGEEDEETFDREEMSWKR